MYISTIHLKGFRNFKDTTIHLTKKNLIIGSNDIGKTNLLYALRIILDKTLAEADLELHESDFYVYEPTHIIEITVTLKDICEECIRAKLRENVSDEGVAVLRYRATRNPKSGAVKYFLYAGKDISSLREIQSRFYLRVLSVKFIGSKRDLYSYVRREKRNLLQDARGNRSESEIDADAMTQREIDENLSTINQKIENLAYIKKATKGLNAELSALSHHHTNQSVVFDAGVVDSEQFVDNLQLVSRVGDRSLVVGGDGRTNQIHLALWAARNNTIDSGEEPLEVCIFCIEEPEIHLHPHQQRKLASYLAHKLPAQVIITTHSPQITCEFSPDSIIRLYDNHPDTQAAGNGINPFTEKALINFGYRLDIIPAEAFFASVVLLVEGVSDELFYKALAKQIDMDLDRLNISVLMVDGIGFAPYVSLLKSLKIPYVIRTDNDIFKNPYKNEYHFAGVKRGLGLCRDLFEKDPRCKGLLGQIDKLGGFSSVEPPQENIEVACEFKMLLQKFNVFVADKDLEHDIQSALVGVTNMYFGMRNDADTVREMQKQKGMVMFKFLRDCTESLSDLKANSLALPLKRCKQIVESQYEVSPE